MIPMRRAKFLASVSFEIYKGQAAAKRNANLFRAFEPFFGGSSWSTS
jgi:hypothetical protein